MSTSGIAPDDDIRSLVSNLRSTAGRTSRSIQDGSAAGYTSHRLTFDDSYANILARTALSFARSLHNGPSHRVRDFAASLMNRPGDRGTSGLRSVLSREQLDLLQVGAAGEVLRELVRDRRWDAMDTLQAHLESVVDPIQPSWDSADSALTNALRSRPSPPSYASSQRPSPPPSYRSSLSDARRTEISLPTLSASSNRTASTRQYGSHTPGSFPDEPDSAISDMDWTPSSSPATSDDTSARSIGTSRPRSQNPSSTSRNLSSLPTTSNPNVFELEGRPISRPPRTNTRVTFSPYTTSYPLSRSGRSRPELSVISHFTPTTSSLNGSSRGPYRPYRRRNSSRPSDRSSKVDKTTRSINSASYRTPSHSLLRSQAELIRSASQSRDALHLARVSDAASRISSAVRRIGAVGTASDLWANGGDTFDMMSELAQRGSIPAFCRAAEKLRHFRPQVERMRVSEIDELISGLRDYREEVDAWRRSRASAGRSTRS